VHRIERARATRGFTLIELLAVLAMIGIIVVAASPSFVRVLRDRRVNRAAMQLVDFIRTARTRAIGHGQPVLLRWNAQSFIPANDATAGTGGVQIVEPIVTTSAAATNCSQTQWNTPATQMIAAFDIQNGEYNYTAIKFYDDTGNGTPGSGASPTYVELCFSSTGRMYIREGASGSATGSFRQVLGVPTFAVFNIQNNPGKALNATTRWVFVPPNGAARLML
jgi:type IV fimbrial biogenesis protein FimT